MALPSAKWSRVSRQRVQIGNRVYTDIPVALALTTMKNRTANLGRFTANAVVVVPSPNRQRDPFFGRFGDPFGMFGGGGERTRITLATDTIKRGIAAVARRRRRRISTARSAISP